VSKYVTQPCPPDRRPETLSVLYQHLDAAAQREQVAKLLAGERVPLDGLLMCRSSAGVAGVMLCVAAAGRVLIAWTPRVSNVVPVDEVRSVVASLAEGACTLAGEVNARFVQLLASSDESAIAEGLSDAGFEHLTSLVYARREIAPGETFLIAPLDFECVPFAPDLKDELLAILEQSYRESLDCPELTGVRTLPEIFESHRGDSDPSLPYWRLIRRKGEWVGCLLLSEVRGSRDMELSYVAVLPAARGLGLGRCLAREAVRLSASAGKSAVVLAVDCRNHPALAMYEDEGFQPVEVREVYWRVLNRSDC
jgi:ribosomal protein S18 acetylase RimI-like enzyme